MAILSPYLSQARFRRISKHVHGDILDIGCQQGQLYDALKEQISSYTGIDMSLDDIIKAQQLYPKCEFQQLNLDNQTLPYCEKFDTIIMSAVIEHIFNLKMLGQGLSKALKPGGKVILTTPTNFGNDIIHSLGCTLGLFSSEAKDDHIAIFNRKRFEIFASEVGLKVKEYQRFQLGCNQLVILDKPFSS